MRVWVPPGLVRRVAAEVEGRRSHAPRAERPEQRDERLIRLAGWTEVVRDARVLDREAGKGPRHDGPWGADRAGHDALVGRPAAGGRGRRHRRADKHEKDRADHSGRPRPRNT